MRIRPRRALKIETEQYINLWIPSVSFWSFTQSHPFVIISWAVGEQDTLDLFIEPCRGLTRELLQHAKSGRVINALVMFSGSYGKSVAMEEFETIVMVASGFGIAAQLPYLKRLIHGYNAREVCARRIHLIWQIEDKGTSLRDRRLTNEAYMNRNRNCRSITTEWRTSRGQIG
jgi:NAD(P)H-flavin reductase